MRTRFWNDVTRNETTRQILARWHRLDLPQPWLVAGCLFQTVWNLQTGRPPGAGIKDYDIFYFDPGDLSAAAEAGIQEHVESVLADLGVDVEVANQARVHTWYREYFGEACPALASVEDGIDRFLVLESCVGIRPEEIYAPYGLDGMYAGTLTPNPLTPHARLFEQKVASYRRRWKTLQVRSPHSVRATGETDDYR
jgi:hypothetical protein